MTGFISYYWRFPALTASCCESQQWRWLATLVRSPGLWCCAQEPVSLYRPPAPHPTDRGTPFCLRGLPGTYKPTNPLYDLAPFRDVFIFNRCCFYDFWSFLNLKKKRLSFILTKVLLSGSVFFNKRIIGLLLKKWRLLSVCLFNFLIIKKLSISFDFLLFEIDTNQSTRNDYKDFNT